MLLIVLFKLRCSKIKHLKLYSLKVRQKLIVSKSPVRNTLNKITRQLCKRTIKLVNIKVLFYIHTRTPSEVWYDVGLQKTSP